MPTSNAYPPAFTRRNVYLRDGFTCQVCPQHLYLWGHKAPEGMLTRLQSLWRQPSLWRQQYCVQPQ